MSESTFVRRPHGRGGLASLSVGTKILLTVAVMALVAVVTGAVAWDKIGHLGERIQIVKATNIARLNDLVSIESPSKMRNSRHLGRGDSGICLLFFDAGFIR